MIITEYVCDKCGHTQKIAEQMWEMSVLFTHYGSQHHKDNRVDSLWCRKCVEGLDLLPNHPDNDKSHVTYPLSNVIEDVSNTLVTWRLIKSAPKDGTPILGFAHPIAEMPAVCWWEKCPSEFMRAGIEMWQWQTKEAGDFNSDKDWAEHWSESQYAPTYWMHLPPIPKGWINESS